MIISEVVDGMFLSLKTIIFSFEEEEKKEGNSTALESEETRPIHHKVNPPSEKDQYLTCLEF